MNLELTDFGSFKNSENIALFLEQCAHNMNIDLKRILSKKRRKALNRKRHMIAFFMHDKAGVPYKDVAVVLNDKSEGTIRYACKKTANFLTICYPDIMSIHEQVNSAYNKVVKDKTQEIIEVFSNVPQL